MNRSSKGPGVWFLIALLVLGTVLLPDRVWAEEGESQGPSREAGAGQIIYRISTEPGPVEMIIDGIIVRPISLAATIIGSVFFVVTLPFSAPSGSVGDAADTLVVTPGAYTFTRCLGCWRPQYIETEAAED